MPSKLRSHLRSNVVGYVALFIALSGSAYAVNGPLAGRNTVGSADIINGEVRSVDARDESIRSVDIEDDSLFGQDMKDGSITGADIDENTLGQVPSAGSIADGAVTTTKFGTWTRRTASVVVPGGAAGNGTYATRDVSVSCPGELAVSGSAFWAAGKDDDDELPLIDTSYSHNGNGRPNGFEVEGGNDTAEDSTLVVAVHCLQP